MTKRASRGRTTQWIFSALRNAVWREKLLKQRPFEHQAVNDLLLMHQAGAAPVSRREFVKAASALGLGAAVFANPLTVLARNTASQKGRFVAKSGAQGRGPVVILGAGLAGLTVAYRLSKAGVACQVYEAQSRVGGRVLTRKGFNTEGMFCELGAELIDSSHHAILDLAAELGLQIDDFRPYDRDVHGHQFFFAGQQYVDEELQEACGPLARQLLKDMEAVFGGGAHEVNYRKHTAAAKRFDRISLAQYLQANREVESWVRGAIEMAFVTEFGLDSSEQSCINLMTLINPNADEFGIYGDSDEAMRIRGGNSGLTQALVEALGPSAELHLESSLVRMKETTSGLALTFKGSGGSKEVQASQVVCTLPFSVLRSIEGVGEGVGAGRGALPLSPVKKRCIAQLGYGTNMKHMVGYSARPWRMAQPGRRATTGYTFTDLPSQTLWDTSRAQGGQSGIITGFLAGAAALDPTRGTKESILRDMETICPGSRALHDGQSAVFRWGLHPMALGSYACPRPGQYTTIVGSAKELELSGKLSFAGEHVSEGYQGYMNGAVETANAEAARLLSGQAGR